MSLYYRSMFETSSNQPRRPWTYIFLLSLLQPDVFVSLRNQRFQPSVPQRCRGWNTILAQVSVTLLQKLAEWEKYEFVRGTSICEAHPQLYEHCMLNFSSSFLQFILRTIQLVHFSKYWTFFCGIAFSRHFNECVNTRTPWEVCVSPHAPSLAFPFLLDECIQ